MEYNEGTDTYYEGTDEVDQHHQQKHQEVFVVTVAQTIVYVHAVMVKLVHALLTVDAMEGPV